VVILPAPDRIHGALFLLSNLNTLEPKAVFPAGQLATPQSIKRVLSAAPANLADATASYLTKRGILDNRTVYNEVRRIFELSEEVHSISTLARRMYTSRRTLGRHLALSGLPVPSHWLQFARLIRVCIRLQSEQTAVFRIAHRAKYPDGFTLSNQMSRILGIRPSLVRTLIGWEWIVESWLSREGIISDLQHTDSLSQC
jgi:AraC-like DNA-binding protein